MKNQTMKKLYVGCSLTHAPETFRSSVEVLRDTLRTEYEILDFVGLTDHSPKEIYDWDIGHCIATCDLFLAICDHPSIGLGYEMATMLEKHQKPTLAVAQENAVVGRIIIGIQSPHFKFERYKTLDQIPALLRKFAQEKGL